MKYTNFDELTFKNSVSKALSRVHAILGTEKNPRIAEDEDHTYDDKFALAEFVTNTSIASQLNVLRRLGLEGEKLQKVLQWVHEDKQTVTLHFQAEDSCSFLKEQEVDVVAHEYETEKSTVLGSFAGSERSKSRVIQKVKEYHWKVQVSYKLLIFPGNRRDEGFELQSRTASTGLVTSGGQATRGKVPVPPISEYTRHPISEVQINWLFSTMDTEEVGQFSIDRTKQSCKTPRRNENVQQAMNYHQSLVHFILTMLQFFLDRMEKQILVKHNPIKAVGEASKIDPGAICVMVDLEKEASFNGKRVIVREYVASNDRFRVEPLSARDGLPASLTIKRTNLQVETPGGALLSSVSIDDVFTPVLPFLENQAVLSTEDLNALVNAQGQSLDRGFAELSKVFPSRQLAKLASSAEAMLILLNTHWLDLIEQYQNGVNYIETMLTNQLVSAIGKEVDHKEFETFMRFHNKKYLAPSFAPTPFNYSIRRPNHYPDGLLSIESTGNEPESIETMVRSISGAEGQPIQIPINAATSIEFCGDRFLHGWMQHRFESQLSSSFVLAARARQFSSFILMVGTMAGANEFLPKAAIVLQNKDEVLIPLLTNVLPSAKEFKDAVCSLSPEQQNFAKAFRGMQLESSVFGVCVVQVKPQLEKLLNLPTGSLTKEIQLTQDLMSLFADYQIPSDLLSYDGDASSPRATKISTVKGHVKSVLDVIEATKEKELLEEERKADMAEAALTANKMQVVGAAPFLARDPEEIMQVMMAPPGPVMRSSRTGGRQARSLQTSSASAVVLQRSPVGSSSRTMAMYKTTSKRECADLTHLIGADESPKLNGDQTSLPVPSSKPILENASEIDDFTLIPRLLDGQLETYDTDNALKSTVLKHGSVWDLLRQKNLLTKPSRLVLDAVEVDQEKKKAFDLLDAISRSGTLSIECAELHVIVTVAHCFENDVMGTVIQDNIDPIVKIERSMLLLGSAIFGQPSLSLIGNEESAKRLQAEYPTLLSSE